MALHVSVDEEVKRGVFAGFLLRLSSSDMDHITGEPDILRRGCHLDAVLSFA